MKELSEAEARFLWDRAMASEDKRASDMPTENDAISAMWSGYQRLKELGWKEAIYCPKDGSVFEVIEVGSTGIFDCSYSGEWPKGVWLLQDHGDLYPSRPVLFRLKNKRK